MEEIPSKITIGGIEISVEIVERCDNNAVGNCGVCGGKINIAKVFNKDNKQTESSMLNTFYHELTHAILYVMGENELCDNEKFVSSFAGFLTDAIKSAEFETNKEEI